MASSSIPPFRVAASDGNALGSRESPEALAQTSMRTISPFLKPENPRVLVIGGSGQLGCLLRRAWLNGASGAPETVWQARRENDFAGLGGPTMVFDPLAAPENFCAAAQAAEVILMLAGVLRGSAAELARNTDLALAALAAARGKPVLIASSAAVYGVPGAQGLCHEDDSLAPVAAYGAAKAAMEAAVAGHDGAILLRIGNVAGADALLGRAPPAEGRVLDILPDGHAPRRSYIGPQALARAIARLSRLAAAGLTLPRAINLALPGVVGMDALLAAAGESWHPRPAPPGVIATVELDVRRALDLGLVPDLPATAAAILADLRGLETGR